MLGHGMSVWTLNFEQLVTVGNQSQIRICEFQTLFCSGSQFRHPMVHSTHFYNFGIVFERIIKPIHTFLDWTQKKPAKIHRLHVKTPREVQQIRLGRRCRKPQGGSIRRQESCSSGRCRLNFHLFRKFTTLSQILYFSMQ